MKEKQIEEHLRKKVENTGGKAFKFSSPGNTGVPDRIVLLPGGRTVFVELKRPGQTLRKIQTWRKRQFEKLGFTVYVIDSKEKVECLIKDIGLEVIADDI